MVTWITLIKEDIDASGIDIVKTDIIDKNSFWHNVFDWKVGRIKDNHKKTKI